MNRAHFILYVADQERSRAFYAQALGVEPALHVPGMTEFALPGGSVLGLMPEAGIRRLLGEALPGGDAVAGSPATGTTSGAISRDDRSIDRAPRAELYLLVDDPAAHHRRALDAGARELSPLLPRDWGHAASYALDPDGHVLAFARPLAADEAAPG